MNRNFLFFICSFALICNGWISIYLLESSGTRDILPLILEVKKNDPNNASSFKPHRNHLDVSSFGTIRINTDTTFTFIYKNSEKENATTAVAFFNLDKESINFSSYDKIEIGIKTERARRIALDINIRERKGNYQFIQKHIEINNTKKNYTLPLTQFVTPASWYEDNDVTQTEISNEAETTIESISFEGCHLLSPGIQDEFTIFKIELKRDQKQIYLSIIIGLILLITCIWIVIFKPFKKEIKVVYIPVDEHTDNETIESKLLTYLANNFANPDLSLQHLKQEFNISKPEISKLITSQTKLTFPQYLSHLRISKANKILLGNTNETISEIGYSVGFNSSSNFIRVFKAQKGVSPKKYRANKL